ncbi:MAG: TolC family protein [Pseudomonadota bacterium]
MKTSATVLLLAVLGAICPARAQTPPPERVDLRAVLLLARESSPRLALDRQGVAVAEAERQTAAAYPNPVVSYGRQRPGGSNTLFDGKRQQDVSVELPLLIGGQRGARVEAADRRIDAARARARASGSDLATEAGAAHVALLFAQERRALLAYGLGEFSFLRELVSGRQTSGMASQYDVLRIDVEVEAWRTRLADAEAEEADRQGILAALLGFPRWRPVAIGDIQPLDVRLDAVAQDNPAVTAARSEEWAALALTELARRERFPAVSLNAGRSWTSDPFGSSDILGVSVEIPILDTRTGAVEKARAEAIAASVRRQLAESGVQTDIDRYAVQVMRRREALEAFRTRMSDRLPGLRQMAEDAYRLGRGSIVELLDATRVRYETQLGQLDLMAGLMEAELRLEAAKGRLVPP